MIGNLKLMGILNITPDSFSDGGNFLNTEDAINHAQELASDGADIIDIGGESTRPGSTAIESDFLRIKDVVEVIAKQYVVSIDTFRPETAENCLKLGAKIINDISALRFAPTMADIIADYDSEVVLMYSKQDGQAPHATKDEKEYKNVILEIYDFLSSRIEYALSKGIKQSKIILDPGMGTFISPNPNYSWEVLSRLNELCQYFSDFRILIGTSRKGFLKTSTDNTEVASQLSSLIAVTKGAKIIRTHNVGMASKFCKISADLNLS